MYPDRFVAGDAENDLAVLRLEGDGLLPTAAFADSDDLTVGDKVYAIGNPLGYELRGTLTDGIVSAINRDVEVDGAVRTLIQTNAALNSGNSGGPLINEYGQVVGINVIKMSSRYSTIEGLGFAIPSASMERIVNDLLTYGALQPEPTLGVSWTGTARRSARAFWASGSCRSRRGPRRTRPASARGTTSWERTASPSPPAGSCFGSGAGTTPGTL